MLSKNATDTTSMLKTQNDKLVKSENEKAALKNLNNELKAKIEKLKESYEKEITLKDDQIQTLTDNIEMDQVDIVKMRH